MTIRAALLRATCLSGLALAASVPSALAQDLIINNGISPISIAGTGIFGNVIVGDNPGPAFLGITAGSTINSDLSIVGNLAGEKGTVIIFGPNGEWKTSGSFTLGNAGSENRLTILDGSKASAGDSYIGFAQGSTGNIATVTGEGSEWNAGANLHVGYEGASNELKILDGGKATSATSWVGDEATADQNIVTVRGEDSFWKTTGNFTLGKSGAENKLNVTDGGKVETANSYIGVMAGSNGNTAIVTGSGSFWEAGVFELGAAGGGNKLNVEAAGNVQTLRTVVGKEAGSTGNAITVTGQNSQFSADEMEVGREGASNTFTIEQKGKAFLDLLTIGDQSSSNVVNLNDADSRLTVNTVIYVGDEGGNNTLNIRDGGQADSTRLVIGNRSGFNAVTVSGPGSSWNGRGDVYLGNEGSNNLLDVLAGASVETEADIVIGVQDSSAQNALKVAGEDSKLESRDMFVGYLGGQNTLRIEAGGKVITTRDAFFGFDPSSTGNTATVTGAGSLWSVNRDMTLQGRVPATDTISMLAARGDEANTLLVENGGRVAVKGNLALEGDSVIGLGAGSVLEAGNLTLSDWSTLSIFLNDEANSRLTVTGAAALDGDLDVKLGTADLQKNRYTVLTAGSVTGTFDSFELLPMYLDRLAMTELDARLDYTNSGVFILFGSDIGGDEDLNINQTNVSDAFNRYYNAGGEIPLNFVPLLGMTGGTLLTTLDQVSGEVGATGGANQMQQGANAFLGLMVQQDAAAPQVSDALASSATSIYGMTVTPTADAPPSSGWSMWGSAFGGKSSLPGDGALGSHDTDTDLVGLATGWTHALSSDSSFGFAIAGGGTRWDLADGLGNGESTFLQFGAHGSKHFGSSYLSLAGAYAWHWMETERRALGETLEADFAASSLAGRIEGGHRFGEKGDLGVTPYAALTAQASFLPDYEESGGSAALAFEDKTATALRSELGLRLDMTADAIRLDAGLAWAHDWRSDANVEAAFRSLPGASFTVNGAEAPDDIALVTAGATFGLGSQTSLSARFDGEFGQDYTTYGGTLALTYSW